FRDLPTSSTALKVLFDSWDSWVVHAGEETHIFMVQTIKDINAEVIEDPSLTRNIGGQSVHAGEVIVNSIIAAGDLELPSRDEEGETHVELPAAEVTPSGRKNKRKKNCS
ncbi:PREDICTED: LOC109946780, partial [Prunus dulcis]